MKVALVTTTIRVPRALALIARAYPDLHVFVVGDRKTPDMDVVNFLMGLPCEHSYYGIDHQYKLGWKVAQHIPENCIQRRSIGFLEALKWGAEIVISWDDDNLPLDEWYAADHRNALLAPYDGLEASSITNWFDVGQLLTPRSPHRGLPYQMIAPPVFSSVAGATVGVCAGACLGDPDISAIERIANGPIVHGLSEVLRHGCVVDPRTTWTVFNSQNTAMRRELVAAWFMLPYCGRMDDIWASLIVQRVMRQHALCVRFGKPMIFQSRNPHDLTQDLLDEVNGLTNTLNLAAFLDNIEAFPSDRLPARFIYEEMKRLPWFPNRAWEACLAWCDDVERVL